MNGLSAAVEIQRRQPPERWKDAIEALPVEFQDEAREYLRGMWVRMQNVRRLTRCGDPDTSRQAAERVTANGSRADHLQRVVAAVNAHPGSTSAELAKHSGLERHEAARRTADAANAGLIVRGHHKTCSVNGTRATTWWPKRARGPIPNCPQPETEWRPAA